MVPAYLRKFLAGDVAQVVQYLPSKHNSWVQAPLLLKNKTKTKKQNKTYFWNTAHILLCTVYTFYIKLLYQIVVTEIRPVKLKVFPRCPFTESMLAHDINHPNAKHIINFLVPKFINFFQLRISEQVTKNVENLVSYLLTGIRKIQLHHFIFTYV
jgi:hypothetical protein